MAETTRARRRAFYDWTRYPELAEIRAALPTITAEARAVLAQFGPRMTQAIGASYILPLIGEPEDRNPIAEELYRQARELAPVTTRMISSIPYVIAFGFSNLSVGDTMPMHEHHNPYLVAILCLEGGEGCHILVNGERRDFQDGEFVVFDYTLEHGSKNRGANDRHVLLITLDPKRASELRNRAQLKS